MSHDQVPVVDLNGIPLSPCRPEKAEQNLRDGLARMENGTLRLNYRPLAYRKIYSAVRHRDGLICGWCGNAGSTLDHVIPVCWGGQTELKNCVMCCRACNHSRNNALPSTFIQWTGFRPKHPVITFILQNEGPLIGQAWALLHKKPIYACISKEEAQIWVALQNKTLAQPEPPESPWSRLRTDSKDFFEIFVP